MQTYRTRSPLPHRVRCHLRDSATLRSCGPATWWWSTDRIARGTQTRGRQLAMIEAALFASSEPLTSRKLAKVAGLRDAREARRVIERLEDLYQRDGCAFHIEEVAGGFQLVTRPAYRSWIARGVTAKPSLRLSPAARETLTVIAYRQPIMRADIEAIRGVQCGDVLRLLLDRGLIRIVGRHPSLGRPVLYGTTKRFLQAFGLKSIDDLPRANDLRRPATQKDPS